MKALGRLRNIGIAAHIDAGKTTLTERILFYSGKIHKVGETHDGTSQMDTMLQERERGITISAAATQTEWTWKNEPYTINIIDTPGHVDFTIEVERALRVLDGMIALFDAVAGVEPQSETVWQQANRYNVPRIAFVNKMDRMGADFEEVVQQINKQLGSKALAVQMPIGEEEHFRGLVDLVFMKAYLWTDSDDDAFEEVPIPEAIKDLATAKRNELLEALAEVDETFLEQYLEVFEEIDPYSTQDAIRRATLSQSMVPVFLGSAYKNKGVQPLLDGVAAYLPSPLDIPEIAGLHPQDERPITVSTGPNAPFLALVFKVMLDDKNRELVFIRVYAGALKVGDQFRNMRTGKPQRIGHFYQLHSNKRARIESVKAGDIAAVVGLKDLRTGDTLAALNHAVTLETLFVPDPVISIAVEAKHSGDLDKLELALEKLVQEDPTFQVDIDEEAAQTILKGMGELHLDVLIRRLKDDFGVDVNTGLPQVTYKEQLTRSVRHRQRLERKEGAPPLSAEIELEIGPADLSFQESADFKAGTNRLQFINRSTEEAIPALFILSIEKTFQSMMRMGILGGNELEHMKVEILDGLTHSSESNELAFELVSVAAYRTMAPKAGPQLLEPIMKVEVTSPNEHLGSIVGDLNRRRAIIKGQELRLDQVILQSEAPLAEMFGYVSKLRALSSGRASFSMQFLHYAPVPDRVAKELLGS